VLRPIPSVLMTASVAAILITAALVGSAGATEPDKAPPVVTLSGTAVKAVEEGKTTGTYELHIVATDGSKTAPQSGVAKIEVGVDGSGQQSWEKSCPEGSCGLEEKWTYSPASYLFEAPRWITITVTDHAGNVTEEEISIEGLEEVREAAPAGPDTTAPTITFLGSAVEAVETGATTGKYELRMLARDGSPSAPQSGVSKIEVAVDGTTVQSWEKYCPVGSCRLKIQWPYTPSSFTGTGHVLTVTVRDHAGNVTTRTIAPDTTPPVVELSGPLTEGLKEAVTVYPLHVHATDGQPEFPGSGVREIKIAVDGTTVASTTQTCPAGSCPLDYDWSFESSKYAGPTHAVTVTAVDEANNEASEGLSLAPADGNIPACPATGGVSEGPPTETVSLPGGGTRYVYAGSEPGSGFESVVPPASFRPATATAKELEEDGFPPRPGSGEALTTWLKVMGRYTGVAPPGACVSEPLGAAETPPSATKGEASAVTGFVTYDPEGRNAFRGASVEFNQPSIRKTGPICPGPRAAESTWVALGGSAHGGFFQAGTRVRPRTQKNPEGKLFAFFEKFPANHYAVTKETMPRNLPLGFNAGDQMFSEVIWLPQLEQMRYFVENEETGKVASRTLSKKGSENLYDGSVVDTLIERPTSQGKTDELANFGSVNFTNDFVQKANEEWVKLGSFPLQFRNVMHDAKLGENVMATTSPLNSAGTGFTSTWLHCHP
jgi:hypothetical protein